MKLTQYLGTFVLLTSILFACQNNIDTKKKSISSSVPDLVEASVLPDLMPGTDTIPMAEKMLDVWKIIEYKLGEKDLPMERYEDATIEFTTEGRIKSSFKTREEMYQIEGNRLIYPNMPEKQATLEDIGNGQVAVLAKDKKGQLARMVLERLKK